MSQNQHYFQDATRSNACRVSPSSARLAPRRLAAALAAGSLLTLTLMPHSVQAQVKASRLPSGLSVAQGQVSVSTVGQKMTVTNSPNAILNWSVFSIGAQQSLHFEQQSASSQVLNRVTGQDPSQILGSLSSNGKVWLLNPNGVLFGQGARINVAGLVSSTLRLNDKDWLEGQRSGRYAFAADPAQAPGAAIVNQGELRSSLGGHIALLGGSVRNEGLIESSGGQILLAAGKSIELIDSGAPNLSLRVTAPQGELLNLGTLSAAGGRIDAHGAVVNQQGIVRADSLARPGEIVLRASETLNLAALSKTSADGAEAGSITLDAGQGQNLIRGEVSAQGSAGIGGQVKLLGRQVGLLDAGGVNASGSAGGGEVLVGGGQQGLDTSVPNAEAVYFGKDASIKTDATVNGDGGRVILWSDKATRAFGSLSARGGAQGGNGGFIETSGGWLDARPAQVSTGALRGSPGTWLLDPYDILITNAPSDSNIGVSFNTETSFVSTGSPSIIRASTLNSALSGSNDGAGHVRIKTISGGPGAEAGNITFDSVSINGAYAGGSSLQVEAAGAIVVNNSTFTNNSELPSDTIQLTFNASGGVSFSNVSMPKTSGLRITGTDISLLNTNVDSQFIAIDIAASGKLTLGTSTVLKSTMEGNAIRLQAAQFLNNNSGSQALQTPALGSRWLVYGTDVAISEDFAPGNLSYAFKQYGNGAILGSGNGFVFSKPQSLQLSSDPISKVYDASTSVPAITNLRATPSVPGDKISGALVTTNAAFGDKNVGAENSINLPDLALSASDANDKPVYGYLVTGLTGSITPAPLVVRGLTFANKVYDRTTVALLNGQPRVVAFEGDEVSIAPGVSGEFSDKNIGTGKEVTLTTLALTGPDAANYYPAVPLSLLANISPRSVQLTGFSALNKVYDGQTVATIAGGSVTGLIESDQVKLDIGSANFIDKNVGTAKKVVLSGFSLSGADAGNYVLESIPDLSANITQANLLVSGLTANNKVYDASQTASLSGTASVKAFAEDQVQLQGSASARFSNKNVGNNKAVLVTGFSLGGEDAGNYQLVPTELNANITPAGLLVSGLTAANKVYDATNTASLKGTGSVKGLAEDQVQLQGSATSSFANRNVGNSKAVTVTGYSLVGEDAGNYQLVQPELSADITPAYLTINGLQAYNKTYDGTKSATLNTSTLLLSPLGSDKVSIAPGASGDFSDKNIGTGKEVTVTTLALTGPDAANYIPAVPLSLLANISPRSVQLAGFSALKKVYDGQTVATIAGGSVNGLIESDQVKLDIGSANFMDKNAGRNKVVTLQGFGLRGPDASNYTLALLDTLSADITPASLTVTGLAANSKVYDASTGATLIGIGQLNTIGADSVSLNLGSANFIDKNVGTAKTVVLNGFSLRGADAGNYVLDPIANLRANITPANLLVTGLSANDKVYDASLIANLSGTPKVKAQADDQVQVLGGANASFADKNVGNSKVVTVTGYSLGGKDAGNYQLVHSELSANITPARLLVSGLTANSKVYDASSTAALSGSAAINPLGNDQVQLVGSPLASFVGKDVGIAKPVQLSGLALSGADASNYQMSLPTLSADITPAQLVYVAMPRSKAPGEPVPLLNGTVIGFVGNETLQTATRGEALFSSNVTAQSPAGSYAVTGAGLLAQNYSFAQSPANVGALTVTSLSPTETLSQVNSAALNSLALPQAAPLSGVSNGLLNMLQAPSAGPASIATMASATATALADALTTTPPTAANPAAAPSFAGVRVSSMSQDLLAELLASRNQYKKTLFASSIKQLAQDPALADLRHCTTLKEVEQGHCLVTDEIKRQIQAAKQVEPTVAQLPGQAEVAIAEEPATAVPLWLNQKRKVKTAALPQIERKIAVLIGVDHYQDKAIPQLDNAVGDAKALSTLFETKLGYETLLLSNASKQTVVGALTRLALELGPKDSVVIYYAGHGEMVEATGLGYWQLADSDSQRPETWLSNADIGRMLAAIGASQVALISDSCYSGSLVANEPVRVTGGKADPLSLLARKSVVVMSSGGNEPVFDQGKNGHSPFAWSLMNQITQVSQWQAGGHLFERVRFAVAKELPQRPKYGSSSMAGHQSGGDYLFEQRQLEVQ